MLIAGFECTDVSHMNQRSADARDCVSKSSKRTGSTFNGVYRYREERRPQLVLLENVTSIEDGGSSQASNADMVETMMRKLGYAMRRVHLEPTDHGFPQRRKRCWFLCAAMKDGDVSAAESQGALFMDLALGIIDDMKLPCLPLGAVLMAEDSADLP